MKKLLILLALALISCSTLKKDNNLTRINQSQTAKTQVKGQVAIRQMQISKDSSVTEFEVTIAPRGEFKFDNTNGFVGEATWLTIKGKDKKLALVKQSTVSTTTKNSNLQVINKGALNSKHQTKSGNQTFCGWALLGLCAPIDLLV